MTRKALSASKKARSSKRKAVQGTVEGELIQAPKLTPKQQRFVVRNGVVETISDDESLGIGVRVLLNGSWGFASTSIVSPAEIDRVTALAVEIGAGGPDEPLMARPFHLDLVPTNPPMRPSASSTHAL